MRFSTLLPLLLCLALVGCNRATNGDSAAPAPAAEPTIPFRQDGTIAIVRDTTTLVAFKMEVAEGDSALARGLMQRPDIPQDFGMLFIFPAVDQQSFWMANTPASLDLFFIRPDSTIATIARYTKPFSQENVNSGVPVLYVLETRAGVADRYGIVESDRVVIRRNVPR